MFLTSCGKAPTSMVLECECSLYFRRINQLCAHRDRKERYRVTDSAKPFLEALPLDEYSLFTETNMNRSSHIIH